MDFASIIWMMLVFFSPVLMIWLGWKVWRTQRTSSPNMAKITLALAILISLSLVILFVTAGTLILQMPY